MTHRQARDDGREAAVKEPEEERRAWDARLGWAHGLTSDDPAERAAALARLDGAKRCVARALERVNEYWSLTLPLGPEEQYREPAFRRALEEYHRLCGHSLPEGLSGRAYGRPVTEWPGLPYGLLFLEWEARYPQEWTLHAKSWGAKQSLLRALARADHDPAVAARLVGLVELAVRRAHRCKDREYVGVARAVDGADLRERLARAADSGDPWARCHAGYVRWMLDRPEVPNTRRVWHTWLAGSSGGGPPPRT
ncbi:hypothetical protein [Streptomyces chilikensis]|uniref:Uncharacterized protein n=1 Tax=Streptomyces chilikensis TaxID=1194079 RepID=A0ABV3EKY9_9ACTN